eukprot:TRINITY_DN9488_c0_g1_i1.p1 TRINITY_DN9488_c0_g1~~TRINITY_DN9488_c0_g1_i1.p1  ORF type:complete len:387 (-),score=52.88 TRINITY_DN9488_c0_g1_i1:121-1233(-)
MAAEKLKKKQKKGGGNAIEADRSKVSNGASRRKDVWRELLVEISEPPHIRTILVADALECKSLLEFGSPPSSREPQTEPFPEKQTTEPGGLVVFGAPLRWSKDEVFRFFNQISEVESVSLTRGRLLSGSKAENHKQQNTVDIPGPAGTISHETGSLSNGRNIHIVRFKSPQGLTAVIKASVPLGGQKRPKLLPEPKGAISSGGSLKSQAQALSTAGPRNHGDNDAVIDFSDLRGLKKWEAQYWAKRKDIKFLQKQVDALIADFDRRQLQARKDMEAMAEADDGWTVVVGKTGRKKTTDGQGITVGAVAPEAAKKRADKAKKAAEKAAAVDFYRFQHREKRRQDLMELQKKWEADKKKIAQLRAMRRFRPY